MAVTNHYTSAHHSDNAHIDAHIDAHTKTNAETVNTNDNILNNNSFFKESGSLSEQYSDQYSDQSSGQKSSGPDDDESNRQRQFHQLKGDVAGLDGRSVRPRLPLGVTRLDSALAGGLALGRVHMLCTAGHAGSYGAVTGFAICLLRHLMAHANTGPNTGSNSLDGPIIWCPASSMAGSGMLYGAGLAALGLDPGRLLIVDSPNPNRRLEVLEDILRTEGLAAVVAEYDHRGKSSDYWMRLARRAQLSAEASGTTGFLLGSPVPASGFETIWNIAPASERAASDRVASDRAVLNRAAHPWHPAWAVDLVHARGGRPCQARLSWNMHSNRLTTLADPLQQDLPDAQMAFTADMGRTNGEPKNRESKNNIMAKPDPQMAGVIMPPHPMGASGHRLAG